MAGLGAAGGYYMKSKGARGNLAGPLLSWAIAVTVLVVALGLALAKYGDFAGSLSRVK
jgi:hypothetical protein